MSENIVVTGATGFVGSHVLEHFAEYKEADHTVIAACRNQSRLPEPYQADALIGNLKEPDTVRRITQKADVICHAASWAEMNGTLEDSEREFLRPTLALIDRAVQNGVRRFVFLSAVTSNPIDEERLHTALPLERIWPHYAGIKKIETYLREKAGAMEVIILRVGFFTGKNYALGILPILLPRLKTHLVPWLEKGSTTLPLIDGRDIARAFRLAATVPMPTPFEVIDIVGKTVPTVREVFDYLHTMHRYPLPHYSISFSFAYKVARFMRLVYKVTPFDPLIVPAVILLLEESRADHEKAERLLGYDPQIDWRESIDLQIGEMQRRQTKNMRMNK